MAAAKIKLISAEDLYRFELITDARISPDGKFIVYTIQRTDKKTEKKYSNLWLVPTAGGRAKQFTYGDQSDNTPRWAPDSSEIAFISNRSKPEQPQLYIIAVDGGEARPLTDLKGTIGAYTWSPDGKQFLLMFRKKDKAVLEREADEQKKKLGVVARHIITSEYKYDGSGYLPEEKWHVWTVNARTGKAKQLTEGNHHEVMPAWSPDGKQIAYIANCTEAPDLTPDQADIFIMPANGGDAVKVDAPIGPKYVLSYSPNGRFITYIGNKGEGKWWQSARLWLATTDNSAPVRNLTHAFDYHLVGGSGSDTGGGDMMPPTWTPDGQTIYVQANHKGDVALMSFSPIGDAITAAQVIDEKGVIGPFTFDANHQQLAYVLANQQSPGQLYLRNLNSGKDKQLTKLNQNWLRRLTLGHIEEVWFEARYGYKLNGWILKPPGFDASKQYPSILEIHGGPQVQYDRGFMHEFYYLAAQGYVVYWSNPRGGQGYGEEHCKAIWNNWGTVDYDDVMDWANYMRNQSYIDPRHMGVTGGSYGGYMTNLIIGRDPDYFKTAVTQRSVSNLISMWGSSDANWQFQQSVANNKTPFADLDKYWEHSPMKYIGNAKTPTLVIHSEQDMRVAQEQGEQVFIALRKLGVDTEMVLFPGEPHGLSRGGRTDRRIQRLQHMLRWFDKYLK
ncbi:MAG: S9 family peptidase [Chloroflexi bacterium]|nr:S9 family peptidase [Chloroflexota bacterium]